MTGNAPAPLPLRVRLPFESEEAFIRRFGANVSPSGIFIPTRSLKPEGTHLRFELVLADGTRLLRGGVVVQDAIEAAPGRRGGMELAFTELDAQSHAVLARILAARPAAPGDAQGIGVPSWRRAAGAPGSPVHAPPPTPEQGVSTSSPEADEPVRGASHAGSAPSVVPDASQGNVAGASGQRDAAPAPVPRDAEAGGAFPSILPSTSDDADRRAKPHATIGAPDAVLRTPAAHGRSAVPTDAAPDARATDLQRTTLSVAPETDVTAGAQDVGREHPASPIQNERFATAHPDEAQEAREDAAREAAQLAQTRARAERVETLARASAREADALVSRIRGTAPSSILAASVDFPEAGIARWKGGGVSIRPSSPAPDSAWALRLLGQRADAPRILELAATEGRPVHPDAEGFASWHEGGQPTGGVGWAARWIELQAHAGEALAGDARPLWVLALPLHAGHRQREAWVAAAARLGFEGIRLTSSPIAAAAAYAHGKGFARRRLLVLSTGRVGFDAAIVQLTGDDVETLSAAGDPFLGLPELEARLAYALRRRLREAGLPIPEPGSAAGKALRDACTTARLALEQAPSTSLTLPLRNDGTPAPDARPFEVTREELDGVSRDLIERQLALVSEVLDEAQLSAAGVDGVLMLGSVERSPLWKQRLSELLGREVTAADQVDPASVIRGAALIGESVVRSGRGRRPFSVFEVLSVPLGLAERSGRLRRVLERGTRIPLSKTLTLPVEAGQELGVLLYQGVADSIADAEPLGALAAQSSLPGEVEIQIRVDEGGRIQVSVEAPGGPRIPLPQTPLDSDAREALLSMAPEGGAAEPRPGGLLGGLRRLFRKV